MSRPYQFSDRDDKITSPLDRRQADPFPPGQPPSFKTNVNRAKTKKWVEAKSVSYGGDDWDDYDDGDEYGVQSAVEERPPLAPSSQPTRSFTAPSAGGSQTQAPIPPRKNSFDQDDERRAFSSTAQPARSAGLPLHLDTRLPTASAQTATSDAQHAAGGLRQASATSFTPSSISDNSENPEHRRNFSPSAMPPPLGQAAATAPPASSGQPETQSPTAAARTIIRPADIYKRMAEEREKERKSLESSRRSNESSRSQDHTAATRAPGLAQTEGAAREDQSLEQRIDSNFRAGSSLEPVTERKSDRGMLDSSKSHTASTSMGLSLPVFESDSSFGKGFFDSPTSERKDYALPPSTDRTAPNDSDLHHQPSSGYRSMVHQAFDTPSHVTKKDSTHTLSSGLTRSDTTGTSDISPIMSHVPSSASSALRHAEKRQASPAIAEEPAADIPASGIITPGYRRSHDYPSRNESPARPPVVESAKQVQLPDAAEFTTSPAFREADIAAAAASAPPTANSPVADLERSAQDAFLASSHVVPTHVSPSIARAESPSKGRVAQIAGKFNQAADSRRNSTDTVGSKKSISSLKGSNSRPSSSHGAKESLNEPLKPPVRPVAERDISFRPRLPGGFDSYASTAEVSEPHSTGVSTPSHQWSEDEKEPLTNPSHHGTDQKDFATSAGPMAALAAAGAAVAASFQKAVIGHDVDESEEDDQPEEKTPTRLTGNIYNRPLPPDRLESTASTIPPTPPAKDGIEQPPEFASLQAKNMLEMPRYERMDTTESSLAGDFESDRLRREIVRGLNPVTGKQETQPVPITTDRTPRRVSDGVSGGYEGYWPSDDDDPPKMSASALPTFSPAPLTPKTPKNLPDAVPPKLPAVPDLSPSSTKTATPVPVAAPAPPASDSPSRPGFLMQRFSWETTPADSPAKEIKEPDLPPLPAVATSEVPPAAVNPAKLNSEDPLSLNPKLSSEPLHVRNAEPGEIPSPIEARSSDDTFQRASSSPMNESTSPVREAPGGPRPLSGDPHDSHGVRPPSFREILAIKSTPARIAKYNETRGQFANMDSGLTYWLQRTAADNPQLLDSAAFTPRPTMGGLAGTSPSVRHKTTTSLTKVFSNQGGSGNSPGDHSVPEYTAPTSQQRSSSGGFSGVKGKDLLKKTGVLGGKGMKEAKGLFAKGKSRLRGGEKVDE